MNTYKIMSIREFADFIKEMPFDKEMSFADTWNKNIPENKLNETNVEGWWGFKKVNVFDCIIVVFGWWGGGKVWCTEIVDGEDYLEHDIQHFIKNYVEGTTIEDYVCVEIDN